MSYASLLKTVEDNVGGIELIVYAAPLSEFLSLKGTIDPPSDPGDSVTIDGSHTFSSGKGFIKLYGTLDKTKLDMAPVGDRDGQAQEFKFEIFHPGTAAEVAEFAKNAKNDDWVFILPDGNGTEIQIGSAKRPCMIKPSWSSGSLAQGGKGFKFEVQTWDSSMFIYTGTITVKS